jgi:YD repeat-containing protein
MKRSLLSSHNGATRWLALALVVYCVPGIADAYEGNCRNDSAAIGGAQINQWTTNIGDAIAVCEARKSQYFPDCPTRWESRPSAPQQLGTPAYILQVLVRTQDGGCSHYGQYEASVKFCTHPDYYYNKTNTSYPLHQCRYAPCGNPAQERIADGTCAAKCSFPEVRNELGICEIPLDKNRGMQCPSNGSNPIHSAHGNKYQHEVDYVGAGTPPLKLERHYNSTLPDVGLFGIGWRSNYEASLVITLTSGVPTAIAAKRPDGNQFIFRNYTTAWLSDYDVKLRLSSVGSMWVLIDVDGTKETYDSTGRLISIVTVQGYPLTLQYSAEKLASVTDQFGRALTFTWNSAGTLIAQVTEPSGQVFIYGYQGNKLSSVDYPDVDDTGVATRVTRVYRYEEPNFPNALTGITDENGHNYATWDYDNVTGRGIMSMHGTGANRVDITPLSNGSRITRAVGVNASGQPITQVQDYAFETINGVYKVKSVSGDPCLTCSNAQSSKYDLGHGAVTESTDFVGNKTLFGTNLDGLQSCRVEGISTNPAAIPSSYRRTLTKWEPTFRIPTEVRVYERSETATTVPTTCNEELNNQNWVLRKETIYAYVPGTGRVQTRTERSFAAGTGALEPPARVTTYAYYSSADAGIPITLYGLLKSIDGPRPGAADTTNFEYRTSTLANSYRVGDLWKVTNALGHVTEILTTDGNGRPTQIKDPNGVITTLAYHPRGWLTSRTVAGQTTSFLYDNVGQLDKVTLPTGAFIDYDYDTAHRLVSIKDKLNNRIGYTLDAMGNHTAEKTYDPSNALKRQSTAVFNALSQLEQSISGAGNITRFTYDDNGNQKHVIDPRDPNSAIPTIFSETLYDALDRVRQTKDNDGGITATTYDVFDNPKTVTDPRGLVTSYTYNGFGEMRSQTSPDSGQTTYLYDEAGNLTSQTDARPVTTTYQYDALNRLALTNYPNDPDVTYVYDEPSGGPGAKGRLTTIIDESGSTKYQYDARGNVTEIKIIRDGITRLVGYSYNGADQVTEMTYPSGRVVTYVRDVAGRVVSVTTAHIPFPTTLLASTATYAPFGPLTGFTLGNGIEFNRPVDLNYRVTGISESSTNLLSYGYDPADNMTTVTAPPAANNSQSFQYDNLNRLTTGTSTGSYGTQSFTPYDANGNRNTPPNVYGTSNNRLSSVLGSSFGYDAAGNTTVRGPLTLNYGQDNRLGSVSGSATAAYLHNAHGQRVKKVANGVTTYYVYGVAGELLAELDSSGKSKFEYAYLEGEPLATMTPEDPNVDSDADGMPDGWEQQYGLNRYSSADAGIDSDGDSLTNLQEFQKGSDPTKVDTDGDGILDGADATPSAHTATWFSPIQRFLHR